MDDTPTPNLYDGLDELKKLLIQAVPTHNQIAMSDYRYELKRNLPKEFVSILEAVYHYRIPLHRLIDALGFGDNDKPPKTEKAEKVQEPEDPKDKDFELNSDQEKSLKDIKKWLKSKLPYYALRGSAGTGKSTLMSYIADLDYNFHFSAPTNKAAKVLSTAIGLGGVRTTYSLLGARMSPKEDKMVLTVGDPPDLGKNPILIVDEAGMVPTVLLDLIMSLGYRCLFVGDPAQLNPVGEPISMVWDMTSEHRTTLKKVERFDNQLLKAATNIRACLKKKRWRSPLENDNDGKEGVFVVSRKTFEKKIKSLALEDWDNTKVCAWRNSTVAVYNDMIREALGFVEEYEPGDRLLLGSPLTDERGSIVAHTDEELVVEEIEDRVISSHGAEIPVYAFNVGRAFTLHVAKDPALLQKHKTRLASAASRETNKEARAKAWGRFWNFSNSFHTVRYGYAMTAHRAQGSTYDHVFVDQSDILANPTKAEAFRSLYVCATRPRISLTTF